MGKNRLLRSSVKVETRKKHEEELNTEQGEKYKEKVEFRKEEGKVSEIQQLYSCKASIGK